MRWQEKGDLTSLGISLKIQKGREHDFGKNFYFKPGDRKRLLTVLIVCLIFCNSFLMPVQRAEAVLPVVAAPEIALGAFVGVVAVAAVGMEVFGYTQQSEEAMAYAKAVWVTGNQVMKDAVVASYNAAVAAGDKTFAISADVRDWIVDGYTGMFAISDPKTIASSVAATGESISVRKYSDGDIAVSLTAPSNYVYVIGSGYAKSVDLNYRSSAAATGFYTLAFGYAGNLPAPTTPFDVSNLRTNIFSSSATDVYYKSRTAAYVPPMSTVPLSTVNDVLSKKNAIRDSFPLALPVPSGQDFVYTPTSNPGIDVHMRNDGTLADDAGKVYSPDQVTVKSTPVPKIATDAAGAPILDAAGNPVIGVPVGAVGVGASAIPGTLVNVRTGEAVQTKTDDTVANPPLDWASQPTTAINWAPLKTAAGAFTKKFPFSIPWDVGRQLAIFDVQPKAPIWRMDKTVDMPDFGTGLKNDIHFKWDFDLAVLDPYAVPLRWFVIIAADVGLMLGLRRFLPE